jgi:hypothetical protein
MEERRPKPRFSSWQDAGLQPNQLKNYFGTDMPSSSSITSARMHWSSGSIAKFVT